MTVPAENTPRPAPQTSSPPDGLAEADRPMLPRGVRVKYDPVRETWFLLGPERAIKLDPIALAILTETKDDRTFGEIVAILADTYNAPAERIAIDAGRYLRALVDRRFVDLA